MEILNRKDRELCIVRASCTLHVLLGACIISIFSVLLIAEVTQLNFLFKRANDLLATIFCEYTSSVCKEVFKT